MAVQIMLCVLKLRIFGPHFPPDMFNVLCVCPHVNVNKIVCVMVDIPETKVNRSFSYGN